MKDTKHIRRIFFLSPGSCPRGVTRGCLGGKNQIPSLTIMLSPAKPIPNLMCELLTLMGWQQQNKFGPAP